VKKVGPAGRSPLGEACRFDNVRNVHTVVTSGADVEQPNPYFKNATPVVIAVICKNPRVVEYLIGVSPVFSVFLYKSFIPQKLVAQKTHTKN